MICGHKRQAFGLSDILFLLEVIYMSDEIKEVSGELGSTGNFIHSYIQEDLKGELNKLRTRFPPETNG